jgi:hypothetical protein
MHASFQGGDEIDVGKAAHRLRSLAASSAKRSKTAVLRDLFSDIEAAIRAGVSQVVIVEELRSLGLDISAGAFRSAMRRLRSRQGSRSAWTTAVGPTDFAPPHFADSSPSVRMTRSGSIYDEDALCRLLRASTAPAELADTVLAGFAR